MAANTGACFCAKTLDRLDRGPEAALVAGFETADSTQGGERLATLQGTALPPLADAHGLLVPPLPQLVLGLVTAWLLLPRTSLPPVAGTQDLLIPPLPQLLLGPIWKAQVARRTLVCCKSPPPTVQPVLGAVLPVLVVLARMLVVARVSLLPLALELVQAQAVLASGVSIVVVVLEPQQRLCHGPYAHHVLCRQMGSSAHRRSVASVAVLPKLDKHIGWNRLVGLRGTVELVGCYVRQFCIR